VRHSASKLGLDRAVEQLLNTRDMQSLPAPTLKRLSVFQANLVALLIALEARMSEGRDGFSIGLGTARRTTN
jgi:hypothetical protein